MREIRFRAWDKELKKWSEIALRDRIYNIPYLTCYDWCQYIGFTDKNGVEIYEGDIVKVEYINDGESYVEVVVVSWNEKEASYAPFNWNYQCDGCDCHTEITSIEVIGNIWENPELLKSEVPHE